MQSPQRIQNTVQCITFDKNSKVKPCLRCGNGTYSKLQICNPCGANKVRVMQRYHTVIKPFKNECIRLRNIEY